MSEQSTTGYGRAAREYMRPLVAVRARAFAVARHTPEALDALD